MTLQSVAPSALVLRARTQPQIWDDIRLQQLWLTMQHRPWRSLALVSSGENVSTIDVANMFARVSWWYGGQATCVFDLRDLGMRLVEHQLRDIERQAEAGNRVFIALRSMDENPTIIPVARKADAAVMCITLGKTKARSAERTLSAIGREHFLGSILVHESADTPATRAS